MPTCLSSMRFTTTWLMSAEAARVTELCRKTGLLRGRGDAPSGDTLTTGLCLAFLLVSHSAMAHRSETILFV